VPKTKSQKGDYTLFSFTKPDGSFDYEKYRAIQEEGNKRKIANVWADEKTIGFISAYLKEKQSDLSRGLCHGVRRGNEQRWFSEQLGIEVLGTDISETATQFPNTVQWDFHEVNPEWVGTFDFVYTNSHDHAYDPKKALDAWVGQLRPGGAVFLEHTMGHATDATSELDPFGVDPHVFPFLIAKWGAGRYAVTEILEPEHTKPHGLKIWIFVIRATGGAKP
jgi:hypothetical protein